MPVTLTLLLLVMVSAPTISMAATTPIEKVNLRSTVNFAILAGESITNTGPTVITGSAPEGGGNVGLYPGTSFTGQTEVTMTGWNFHHGDTVADVAKQDLGLAYDDAAGRTPTSTFTENDNQLGGKTLKSGVYAFGHANTANLTAGAPLILDAEGDENAVFIFQASSDLITASGSEIILINGARFCRVFWQVTSSATLGTNSHFAGHIFALTSITADTGSSVQGQLLARNGTVILRSNTLTNSLCETVLESSSNSTTSNDNSTPSNDNSTTLNNNSTTTSINTTAKDSNNPKTGDGIHMLMGLLALVTISALTVFVVNKKAPSNKK